jgi:hypothetical protein
MKFNKLILVGITMILGGLENIFRIIPYETGAKNACRLGDDCLYQGSFVIILGLALLIVQYRGKGMS